MSKIDLNTLKIRIRKPFNTEFSTFENKEFVLQDKNDTYLVTEDLQDIKAFFCDKMGLSSLLNNYAIGYLLVGAEIMLKPLIIEHITKNPSCQAYAYTGYGKDIFERNVSL